MERNRVSIDVWEAIENWRARGLSYREISQLVNVPSGTIGGYFSASGRSRREKILEAIKRKYQHPINQE